MTELILRINDDLLEDFEIKDVSINYSLKDIKEPSKRKTSFTKPITVLQTANTDRVFKNLYNINSFGGFDMTKKVNAELLENGVTILKGYMYLETVTRNHYEITLAANDVDIFKSVGERKLSDLQFPEDLYSHTLNQDHIIDQFTNSINYGSGIYYTVIDYDNNINSITDLKYINTLTPSVFCFELFEKILSDNGYKYTLTEEIKDDMERLVIPFNGNFNIEKGADYRFLQTHYHSSDGTNISISDKDDEEDEKAYAFFATTAPTDENLLQDPFGYPSIGALIFPTTGTYRFYTQLHYNNENEDAEERSLSIKLMEITTGKELEIADVDIPHTPKYNTGTEDVPIMVSVYGTTVVDVEITVTSEYVNKKFYPCFQRSEKNVKIGKNTMTVAWLKNYIFNDLEVSINNVLPKNYYQKDFLNDLFKHFNMYVQIDSYDSKLLHFKTYKDFYNAPQVVDWSEKIDNSTIEFTDLSNNIAKEYNFKFADGEDLLTQDYKQITNKSLSSRKVINPSEIASGVENIELTSTQTTLVKFSLSLHLPKILVAERNELKPKILFLNKIDLLTDTAIFTTSDTTRYLNTCTPFRTADLSDPNNFYLGFDSSESYAETFSTVRTNNNIYSKYYQEEIESNFNGDFKLLTADFKLNELDVTTTNFRNLIFIKDPIIGDAYYRLNAIKKYSPASGKFCEVELIKVNPYTVNIPATVDHTLIPLPTSKLLQFNKSK